MEIYIVRHGETEWNKDKRLQGSTDIMLNENGRALAIETGENLLDTHIDLIYSSPLKRAYETAELIRHERNIEIKTDDRIRELSFGCYEGLIPAEFTPEDSLNLKHLFNQPELFVAPPDGETLENLIKRASDFMKNEIEPLEANCKRIMIVAHGAMNKAIMSYIKKHPVSEFWSGGLQRNCNVIIVDYSNKQYSIIDETKIFYIPEDK